MGMYMTHQIKCRLIAGEFKLLRSSNTVHPHPSYSCSCRLRQIGKRDSTMLPATCSNCLNTPVQQRLCKTQRTQRRLCRVKPLVCQASAGRRVLSTCRSQKCACRRLSRYNAGTNLTFNIAETSISFPFQKPQAQQLSKSIQDLIQTFAAKQKAERPKRWTAMEYKYKSEVLSSLTAHVYHLNTLAQTHWHQHEPCLTQSCCR